MTTQQGAESRAQVVAARRADDLAVLGLLDPLPGPFLVVGPVPAQGDPITAWGHPYGLSVPHGFLEGTLRFSRVDGIVSAVGTRALQLDAALAPGMSGGPVVDAEGRLVGVVSRRFGGGGPGFAGRVDDLPTDGGRGPGLHLSAAAVGSVLDDPGDPLAVGVRGELALADRIVVSTTAGFAPLAPVSAVRWDRVDWTVFEGAAGLRQVVGRGGGAIRLDAFGGAAWVQTTAADKALSGSFVTYLLGGAWTTRSLRVDVAWLGSQDLRLTVGLRLPAPSAFF